MQKTILAQEEQLRHMQSMLESTVSVKVEYERVIQTLLQMDSVKDLFIEICMQNREEEEISEV